MHLIKSMTPGSGAGGRRLGAGSPRGAMGGGPRRLLMEPCISIACCRSPLGLLWGGGRSTAGIRGGYSRRKADGRMDSRRAAVLLLVLLLTDWGCAEGPGGQDEGHQIFVVSYYPLPVSPFLHLRLRLVLQVQYSGCRGLHWVLASEEMAPQLPFAS